MIKSLIGKVDGQDVIFNRTETGQWTVIVPFHNSGKYVIELYATDEAGNTSYFAKVLFTLDTSNLCTTLILLEYEAEYMDPTFIDIFDGAYDLEIVDEMYDAYLLEPFYNVELVSNIRC